MGLQDDGRSAVLAARRLEGKDAETFAGAIALDGERAAWAMDSCGLTRLYIADDLDNARPTAQPGCATNPSVVGQSARLDRRNRLSVVLRCPLGCRGRVEIDDPNVPSRPNSTARVDAKAASRIVVRVPLPRSAANIRVRKPPRLFVELIARDRTGTPAGVAKMLRVTRR